MTHTREVSGNMLIITDDKGRQFRLLDTPAADYPEPPIASIVMSNGNYGNAWQRHGNDGLWHSTTGGKRRWSQLLRMRNLVLVYEAAERPLGNIEKRAREPKCEYEWCEVYGRHTHVGVQR